MKMRFWLFLFSQDSSDKGKRMPVITIQVLKGLDKECINEMAKRVSEVVAEIECRPSPRGASFRSHIASWRRSIRALHS